MQPLLLLHGALGSPAYFEYIKNAFSNDFQIHAPAFEGHAYSPLNHENLNITVYVQQVVDYCNEHGLEKVSIFGYSMGGYVALVFASQYPERVGSVITLATKYDWNAQVAKKEAGFLHPELISEKVPKFATYLQQLHGEAHWKTLVTAVANLLLHLGEQPLLTAENLKRITCKVQIMVGDSDNMVSIDESRQLVEHIAQANFAVLPSTIHPFEKVNQGLLLFLLQDFFQKLNNEY